MIGLTLTLATDAFAQIKQGQWIVDGDLSFTSEKTKQSVDGVSVTSPSTSLFTLNPDAGYFFMDKLAAGLRINMQSGTGGYSNFFGVYLFVIIFYQLLNK